MAPLQTGSWDIFRAISTGFAAMLTALGVVAALYVALRERAKDRQRAGLASQNCTNMRPALRRYAEVGMPQCSAPPLRVTLLRWDALRG